MRLGPQRASGCWPPTFPCPTASGPEWRADAALKAQVVPEPPSAYVPLTVFALIMVPSVPGRNFFSYILGTSDHALCAKSSCQEAPQII